ncbi:MAG: hypothetical protein H8E98_03840 [Bacteroidetes bacterium]|nr:hypothetical protein [Bacteroidota bacterium]
MRNTIKKPKKGTKFTFEGNTFIVSKYAKHKRKAKKQDDNIQLRCFSIDETGTEDSKKMLLYGMDEFTRDVDSGKVIIIKKKMKL